MVLRTPPSRSSETAHPQFHPLSFLSLGSTSVPPSSPQMDTSLIMFFTEENLGLLVVLVHVSSIFFLCSNLSRIQFPTTSQPKTANLSSPTCINTNKGAFGNVVQAADTPALVLCLEQLEPNLESVLHQPVCAHVWVTVAAFVTLINSGRRLQENGSRHRDHWSIKSTQLLSLLR